MSAVKDLFELQVSLIKDILERRDCKPDCMDKLAMAGLCNKLLHGLILGRIWVPATPFSVRHALKRREMKTQRHRCAI